jgi:hypothetical protein
MAKLYRELILKERVVPELVQISLGADREAVGDCGD